MNKQKISIVIVAMFIVGGIVFFTTTINKTSEPNEITIQSNVLLPEVTKKELLKESDIAIIGSVEGVRSFKAKSKIRPGKEDIFSDISLQVKEYLYNPKNLSSSRITVRVPGGTLGNTTMRVNGAPVFKNGEQVVVFLKQNQDQTFAVVGWAQGKYTIDNGIVGKGNEKVFVKDIFGRDNLTINEFKKEIKTK